MVTPLWAPCTNGHIVEYLNLLQTLIPCTNSNLYYAQIERELTKTALHGVRERSEDTPCAFYSDVILPIVL